MPCNTYASIEQVGEEKAKNGLMCGNDVIPALLYYLLTDEHLQESTESLFHCSRRPQTPVKKTKDGDTNAISQSVIKAAV